MSLALSTINVNGLRDNRKRDVVFKWLAAKNIDLVCLQETHCIPSEINQWQNEWKLAGGGESIWDCGSSDSKGVGILLNKSFNLEIHFLGIKHTGRLMKCDIKIENDILHITNIYSPNIGSERKSFFNSVNIVEFEDSDMLSHYNIVLGDFNCAANKNYDRCPSHIADDVGLNEFQNMINRNELYDIWRNQHPDVKKFTFKRGNSKSRIDYILASKNLSSKLYDSQIKNCPFSDHDMVTTKLKIDEIERGPGIWIMNLNTIKSNQFQTAFRLCWEKWKGEKGSFSNILHWWDTVKMRIKSLTMEVSTTLNLQKKKH